MKLIISLQAILCLVFFTNDAHSQSTLKITGQLISEEKKPLAAATVYLFRKKNLELVKTYVTSDSGIFEFEKLKADSFILSITCTGYKRYTSDTIILDTAAHSLILPPIQMTVSANNTLQEVTVTTKKPFIEQQLDKMVVNVEGIISNTGSNALEILEKSPGVIVDDNGGISFKGKSGVLILIDDKPTYLSGASLAAYLKALPSTLLDKIELMSNPPARYSAESSAGVINIVTKKIKVKGFNGVFSASFGVAVYARANGGLSMNYRNGKINVFGNLSYGVSNSWRRMEIQRTYFAPDGSVQSSFEQSALFVPVRKSPTIKTGIDFFVSPKTTWGLVFTGTGSENTGNSPVSSIFYDKNRRPDSVVNTENFALDRFSNIDIDLNLRYQFDSTGRDLYTDVDYVRYSSTGKRSFQNNTFNPTTMLSSSENLGADLPADISIYAAKSDYQQNLGKNGKLELGLKTSWVSANNVAYYYYNSGGIIITDNEKTNHFTYRENINAAYASISKDYKRFSLKAGLRMENTNGNGHQLGNAVIPDSAFRNSYVNLFPTLYFSWKLDSTGKNSLNLSYGRRIKRPYYQDLNPFIFLVDKFSWYAGNPFLKPQFSHNLELSWHYKGIITTSLTYSYLTNLQLEVVEQSNAVFISRTGNIGKATTLGMSVNLSLKPVKGWSTNLYSELVNTSDVGTVYGNPLRTNANYLAVNLNNQFVFNKVWSAELSGFYISSRTDAQFVKTPLWQLTTGLQKKIWAGKGSVRISVRDILLTLQPRGTINVPGAISAYQNHLDSRVFTLGLTYNFGKAYKNTAKHTATSADEEQGRVKN